MAIDKLEQYANDLKVVDDGEYGQFEYIIDMGKQTKSLDQKLCTEDNQMYGCQAQVWIVCQKKGKQYYYLGNSDAFIVKGLVAMMTQIFSGQNAKEIENFGPEMVNDLGLGPALTSRRQIGMMAMVKHIQKLAKEKR